MGMEASLTDDLERCGRKGRFERESGAQDVGVGRMDWVRDVSGGQSRLPVTTRRSLLCDLSEGGKIEHDRAWEK